MKRLFIFDGLSEKLITVLGEKDGMLPFDSAPVIEQLNKDFTLTFTVPADNGKAEHVIEGNIVGYLDLDGDLQAFNIYKVEEVHNGSTLEKVVSGEHVFYELLDDVVEDLRVLNGTATDAVTKAIDGSRWQVGTVVDLGLNNIRFYYNNALNNLRETVNVYGGELRFRLTYNGGKITGRYVDLLARRGADTGKRFEYTKDMNSVKRTVDRSEIKTALYGRGKSSEIEETGGFTRKANFADVEWAVMQGDPVNKPLGQEFVGDPQALELYGRLNADGTRRHRYGIVDFEEEDPAILLAKTWQKLQETNKPRLTYEVDVIDLEQLAGYGHEAVRIGDTVIIIDRDFNLTVEARVIEIERDIADTTSTKVKLGNFIPLFVNIAVELDNVKRKLTEKEGIWDGGAVAITDNRIEVVVPNAPTNVTANGLFESINVKWNFDPSIRVAGYEVYASQLQNFTVDSTNLVFRGKTGGYNHVAEPNQTWYFKVRAFNPAGDFSPFVDVTGNTVAIHGDYLADLTVGNGKIKDLSADKITFGTLDGNKANIVNLNADNINAGILRAKRVELGAESKWQAGYNPKYSYKTLFDYAFIHGNEFWADTADGEYVPSTDKGTAIVADEAQNGGKVLQFTGEATLYALNALPVNLTRRYRITYRTRQTVAPTVVGTNLTRAGVAMLDVNFNVIGVSYFTVDGADLSVDGNWQTFTADITGAVVDTSVAPVANFMVGTAYVRPVFAVNYAGGDGTAQVDIMQFEDVTVDYSLEERITSAELLVTDENIIATVTSSQEFKDKADSSALDDYVTNTALGEARTEIENNFATHFEGVNGTFNTVFEQISQVDQKADAIDFKFSNSGGVNLIKNSAGFAGTDFWLVAVDTDAIGQVIGSIGTRQNSEIQKHGAGSAFVLAGGKLTQTVTTVSRFYTISTRVKKGTAGYAYIKVTFDDGLAEIREFASGTEYNYEPVSITIAPIGNEITVEIYGDNTGETLFTSTMINKGTVALTWQHSAGEIYNTNVLMDEQGIKVLNSEYNGYTAITPQEFAGYVEVRGEMKRVFTLNKDVTVMSRARFENEVAMNPVKIIPIRSAQYKGWAFIASFD